MFYKFSVFTTILCCIFYCQLYCQSKEANITLIRQEYQTINSDRSLKSIRIDDAEQIFGHATDGGAELTGYYKNDSIYKITVEVGLSFGEITKEYYFKNDSLFLVYQVEKDFTYNDSLNSFDYAQLHKVFEGRYYFSNGNLFNKILSGKTQNIDPRENLLSESKRFFHLVEIKIQH